MKIKLLANDDGTINCPDCGKVIYATEYCSCKKKKNDR